MVGTKILTYEAFIEKATEAMKEYIGEDYHVTIQKVKKNNGIVLHGISVFGASRNISPTIYLEEFYEQYCKGNSFGEVMRNLIECYEAHVCHKNLDMSFFLDYEQMRTKIAYKLVNREKNEDLLSDVPYVPFLNLAVLFFCAIENEWIGNGTVLIRNNHLKMWNVTVDKIYEDAIRNTPLHYPVKICTMSDLIMEMMYDVSCDNREKITTMEAQKEVAPMRILTNEQKVYGAAVMLYDGVMQKIADGLKSNLVILPSSVHEVIALPVINAKEALSMEEMVREINRTQVGAEEILSDQVYYYERATGRLSVAQEVIS